MNKTILIIAVVAVATVAGGGGAYYYFHTVAPAMKSNAQCSDPGSISSHVYNPDRLDILNSCIRASGIVENVFEEADGDYHLRLALDSQYANLTNSANDQYQYGDLVVEVICALPITQQDAVSACQGYTNNITIPSVNDHIKVTGPYALDTDHYNWAEIHPVYTLTIS
ncbi:MAG TPA: hypothetical protein VFV92_09540 [Candidatus Bathyarchaeia archaeon]|nr:hypothetical protein [Candidatus Bathyarchaeia archaeon]